MILESTPRKQSGAGLAVGLPVGLVVGLAMSPLPAVLSEVAKPPMKVAHGVPTPGHWALWLGGCAGDTLTLQHL